MAGQNELERMRTCALVMGEGGDERSAAVFNLISYEDDHYDKAHRA